MLLQNISPAHNVMMSFCSCFFQRCDGHTLNSSPNTEELRTTKYLLKCNFFTIGFIFTIFIYYCHRPWLTGQCNKSGTFSNSQPLYLLVKLLSSLASSAVQKHVVPQGLVWELPLCPAGCLCKVPVLLWWHRGSVCPLSARSEGPEFSFMLASIIYWEGWIYWEGRILVGERLFLKSTKSNPGGNNGKIAFALEFLFFRKNSQDSFCVAVRCVILYPHRTTCIGRCVHRN